MRLLSVLFAFVLTGTSAIAQQSQPIQASMEKTAAAAGAAQQRAESGRGKWFWPGVALGAAESDEFKRLTRDRETAFAAFESMYVENVVGDFEVTCSYSARGSGVWNGTIESSPPIKLHVFFESAFFDQPAFR